MGLTTFKHKTHSVPISKEMAFAWVGAKNEKEFEVKRKPAERELKKLLRNTIQQYEAANEKMLHR